MNGRSKKDIEALADWLLSQAKARGAKDADIQYSEGEGTSLSLKDGEVEESVSGASSMLGIRVIMPDGRQGTACGNRFDKQFISDLSDWAISNARAAEPEEGVSLYKGSQLFADPKIMCEDAEISCITAQDRMKNCRLLTELAHSDKRIASVRAAGWQDGNGKDFYASTEGLCGWESGSSVGCDLLVLAQDGKYTELGGYGKTSRKLQDINLENIATRAVKDTVQSLGGQPVRTGNYTVVIEPEAAAALVDIIGELFCATDIQKNCSMMKGRLGKQVASSCFSLSDNGRIPWQAGTSCWDAEGVPTQETRLIENGVAMHYLYNLQSAYKDKTDSTGNCVRGFSTLPDVGCSNLVVKGGTETSQALIKGLKRAIYLTEFMGLHTIDAVSGDFSVGAKGLLIENGEFTAPVSGITIASNLIDFIKNITAVGSDVKFYGSVATAALVVENVTVAGE